MSIPDHRKLGYDQMLEMNRIEDELRQQGITGVALHFKTVEHYERIHKNDPSYRERQEKWLATQTASTPKDLFKMALEEIRDGHNDPRGLARSVLGEDNV